MVLRYRKALWIVGFAVLTVLVDIPPAKTIYPNQNLIEKVFSDFIFVMFFGLPGIYLTEQAGTPFLSRGKTDKSSLDSWVFIALLSFAIIILNTFAWYVSYRQAAGYLPWVRFLTPLNAVLLSAKAALSEEVIFRLFLFPLLIFVLKNFTNSIRIQVISSLIISAFIFSYSLHSGSPVSFVAGIIIGHIYYKKGLGAAMVVHFIADCIPFVMLSYLL